MESVSLNVQLIINRKVIELVTQPRRRVGTFYTIVRRYYEHTTSRDFKKTIAEVFGKYIATCIYIINFNI